MLGAFEEAELLVTIDLSIHKKQHTTVVVSSSSVSRAILDWGDSMNVDASGDVSRV